MPIFKLKQSYLSVFDFGRAMGASTMPNGADVLNALCDLSLAQRKEIVVGGIAVGYYGYERATTNIDLLYDPVDEPELFMRLDSTFQKILKSPNGWHHFVHRTTKLPLKLVPAGHSATYGPIPQLSELNCNKGIASLFGLVWLKLVSGRMKDDADLMEVAKSGQLSTMRKLTAKLPPELQNRFSALLDRAELELRTDKGRIENADRAEEPSAKYGKLKKKRRKIAKAGR